MQKFLWAPNFGKDGLCTVECFFFLTEIQGVIHKQMIIRDQGILIVSAPLYCTIIGIFWDESQNCPKNKKYDKLIKPKSLSHYSVVW
jgi:hypothetical protein